MSQPAYASDRKHKKGYKKTDRKEKTYKHDKRKSYKYKDQESRQPASKRMTTKSSNQGSETSLTQEHFLIYE